MEVKVSFLKNKRIFEERALHTEKGEIIYRWHIFSLRKHMQFPI